MPAALEILTDYDWPGNVRQLANVVEHAIILSDGLPIGVEHLPTNLRPLERPASSMESAATQGRVMEQKPARPIVRKIETGIKMTEIPAEVSETATLRDLEILAIYAALERNDGNKAKAAKELGISLKTLYNKLNQSDGKKTA